MKEKRYLIVDKETGEVVNETNRKEEHHPFLRVLSWIVLMILTTVFGYVVELYLMLAFWIYNEISQLSRALFIVLLISIGSTMFNIMLYGINPLLHDVDTSCELFSSDIDF